MVSANQLHAQPVIVRLGLVVQQHHWLVEMADNQINAAVVVEIAKGDAAREMGRTEIRSALVRYVAENTA